MIKEPEWQELCNLFIKESDCPKEFVYAVDVVDMYSATDAPKGLYMISTGTLYIGDKHMKKAGFNQSEIDKMTIFERAYESLGYFGIERDAFGGEVYLQFGKNAEYFDHEFCPNPDEILHGNINPMKYIKDNYLN